MKSEQGNTKTRARKSHSPNNWVVAYFDGSCQINPYGHIGIGCYITKKDKEILSYSGYFEPSKSNSNNVAEYLALDKVLTFLLENGLQDDQITIYGDSQVVVYQMKGKRVITEGLYVPYAIECKEKLKHFKKVSFTWVPRINNTIADNLSKKALSDRGIKVFDQEHLIKTKSTDVTKIIIPFGKYCGRTIASADKDYLKWLIGNVTFTKENIHIKRAIVKNYTFL